MELLVCFRQVSYVFFFFGFLADCIFIINVERREMISQFKLSELGGLEVEI